MNKEQAKKLYDATSKDYGINNFELFVASLNNEKKRKEFYDLANVKYDIGNTIEEFEDNLGIKKKIPVEQGLATIEPEAPKVGGQNLPPQPSVSVEPTVPSPLVSPLVSEPLKSLRGADQTKIAARAKELGLDVTALSSAINDFEADDDFIIGKAKEYGVNKAEYDKSKAAYTWRSILKTTMRRNGVKEDDINFEIERVTNLQKLDVDPKTNEFIPATYGQSLERVSKLREIINTNITNEGDRKEAMRAFNIDAYATLYQGLKDQSAVNNWAKVGNGNVFVGAGLDMLRLTDPERAKSLKERITNQYASNEDKALYYKELETIGLNAIAFEVDRNFNRLTRSDKAPSENTLSALNNWKSLAEKTKRSQPERYGDITGADIDRMLFDVTEGLETSTGEKAIYNVATGASEWLERGLSAIWNYATLDNERRQAADMALDHSKYVTEEVLNYGDTGSSLREAEYIPKLVDEDIKKQVDAIMANTSLSRNEKYEQVYPLIKSAYVSGGIEFFSNPNKGNINLTSKNVLHLLSTSAARSIGNMIPTVASGGMAPTMLVAGLDAAAMKYDEKFREGENNPLARSIRSGITVGALAGIMDEAAALTKALRGRSASLLSKPTAISAGKNFISMNTKEYAEELSTEALDGDIVKNWNETLLATAIVTPTFSGPISLIDARRSSDMYRQLWFEAGASPLSTKVGLKRMLDDGSINSTQYDDAVKRVDRMSQIVRTMPTKDMKGNPLSDGQKAKYADNLMKKYDAQSIPETLPTKVAEQITQDAKLADEENAAILEGAQPPVAKAEPGKRLFNEPNPAATEVETKYKQEKGITTPEPAQITKLDENKSKTIADAYEAMEDNPNDPEVKAAYEAMATETMDQYKAIADAGVVFEIWEGEGEPYKNSEEMIKDARDNKHMYILSTENEFGGNKITEEQRNRNPLLKDSGATDKNGKPLLINDVFRGVHDFFGHTKLGNSFGAIGEENAWNVHARMYSPLARRAMTTETRGQNSWVNFGPQMRNPDGSIKKKGDPGFLSPRERAFAEQKIGLLPEEFSNIEDNYSVPGPKQGLAGKLRARLGEGGRLAKAAAALRSTGINIKMVADPNEFDAAVKASGGQQGLGGVFIAKNGEILINETKLNQGITGGSVIWHEASHPIVNIIRNTNPKLFKQVLNGLNEAAKTNKGVANAVAWANENYASKGEGTVDDESIVETIAGIADGAIDIQSIPTGFKQSLIDFINSIAKAFGFDQILNDTDIAAFKKVAGDVANALREGQDIASIVGEENVKSFQNKGIQAKIDSRLSEPGIEVDRKEKLPLKISTSKEQETVAKVNELINKYPNALTDRQQWKELMSRVFTYEGPNGELLIPAFPEGLARMASSVNEVSKELAKVSSEQRKLASEGLKGTKEIGKLYEEGKMDEVDTGLYFLWNIMSIGISPYPQESGFLQAVDAGVDKYINAAANGTFDDAMLEEYLQWVNTALPLGTPGAGSKSNLNSFGTNFLAKASDVIESGEFKGKTRLQALHEIISDRKTPTNDLRKKWHANMSNMQFNNKIFDFILLTTGRSDLFVVDRVRVDHFWDGDNMKKQLGLNPATSIYDGSELSYKASDGAGFSKMLSDVPGMVFTELANRAMADVVAKAYKKLGVNESPDVGRFHWETWVAASAQEVSHGSIDAIVQRKDGGKIKDAGIRQGKYGAWDFNFKYRKVGDQPFRYEFTDNNGNIYIFDDIRFVKEEIDNQAKKTYGSEETRFLLKDGEGEVAKRKTGSLSSAWYDQPGVNAQKYFDFLRSKAKEVIPAPDVVEDQGVVIDFTQGSVGNRDNEIRQFIRENIGEYSPEEISQTIQDELGIPKDEADAMVAAESKAKAPLAEEIKTFQEGQGEEKPRAMADQFDGLAPEVESQIDDDARTYFAKTNKQTDAEVDKFIEGKDMAELADYVVSNPNIPARVKIWMAAKVANKLNDEIEAARAEGNDVRVARLSEKQANIYNTFAREATELGQAVQAFVAFNNDPSAVNFFMNKIMRQLKEKGVESITDQQRNDIIGLMQALNNARPGLPKNKAIIQLSHYLGRLAPVKIGDVIQSIWYAHILSGVSTQLKNIWANTIMIAFEVPISSTWQSMKNLSLMPYVYAFKGLGSGLAKGIVKGADILRSGVTEKDGDKFFGTEPVLEYFSWKQTKLGKLGGGAVGKFLDFPLFIGISPTALKMVGRALAGADAFFSTTAQEAMANMMAYNEAIAEGKSGITPNGYRRVQELLGNTKQNIQEAKATAISEGFKPGTVDYKRRVIELAAEVRSEKNKVASEDFGKRVTLTNEPEGFTRAIYQVATAIQEYIPASRVVIPFTRIVSNISEMIINYSPAGAYRALTGIKNPKLSFKFSPDGDNKLSDEARGELFLKSSMAIAAVTILMNKVGTDDDDWFEISGGGPSDFQKKYELIKGGWRPYTITLKNGKKINYADWPIAGALGGIGTMRDVQNYEKEDVKKNESRLGLAAYGYLTAFYDKSLIKGVSDLVDIFRVKGKYGPDATTVEKLEKFAANQAKAMSMTNFSQQVFKLIQEYNDDPIKEAKGWETLYRDLPVLNDGLNPIIDVFGDPVTPSTSERLLPWMTIKDEKKDELIAMLNKKGIFIGIPEEKPFLEVEALTERKMTRDELYRYRKMAGENTKTLIINNLENIKNAVEEFEGDKQMAWEKMIGKVVGYARKVAYVDLIMGTRTDLNFDDINEE